MKFKLIDRWQEKKLTCIHCGTNKSVKYSVISNGSCVPCCNKCVALMIGEEIKISAV